MGEKRTGGAGDRVRDYLRWKPRGRRTGAQIVVQSVASGVLFTVLMSLFDAVTGSEDVTLGSALFRFTFFTLFMIGAGFLFNPRRASTANGTPAAPPGG